MKRLLTIGMFAWFCAGCFFAACPASAKRPATTQRLASVGPRADKSTAAKHSVAVGMTDTVAYFPLLEGRRVAVLTNHTAVADMPGALGADSAGRIHLVDLLYRRGFDVTGIFSPEHGFRGKADAGETVGDAVDPSTGIPILSLYNGNAQRPSERAMQSFDVLIVDMQDVGLRFYTYHISMLRLMEACAAVDKTVIVLDRPNPNGCHIDGPVLEKKYRSGVGMLPVPVLHGLTMGEIARMAIGEEWVEIGRAHV